jgi:predicted dehydrogenase
MTRIAIVGYGKIADKYLVGIRSNPDLQLVAVCDIDPGRSASVTIPNVRFYTDYRVMIEREKPEFVVIATPPASHEEIASVCLAKRANVLSEKPGSLTAEGLDRLFRQAREKRLVYDVILHWLYGREVLYMRTHLPDFGAIRSVAIRINDPYLEASGRIRPDRIGMGGAWIDSGINALSFADLLVGGRPGRLVAMKSRVDVHAGQPYRTHHEYDFSGIPVVIDVSWTCKLNRKVTTVVCEKGLLVVEHSHQRVRLNGAVVFDGRGGDRLANHYHNYFTMLSGNIDPARTERIHRMMYAGCEKGKSM